jgi:hypothetical protein
MLVYPVQWQEKTGLMPGARNELIIRWSKVQILPSPPLKTKTVCLCFLRAVALSPIVFGATTSASQGHASVLELDLKLEGSFGAFLEVNS